MGGVLNSSMGDEQRKLGYNSLFTILNKEKTTSNAPEAASVCPV